MLSAGKNNITINAAFPGDHPAIDQLLPAEATAILNLIEDPVCMLLADGRMLTANTALRSIFDLKELQARQHNFIDWVHPRDKALLQRKLLLVKTKNQPYHTAARLRLPSGHFVHYQLRMQLSGDAIVLIGKQAQNQHIEQPDAVSFCLDKALNLVRYHEQLCHMLGYSFEAFRQLDLVRLLHPKDYPVFTEHIRTLFSGENKSVSRELRLQHKDQHYCWVHFNAHLVESVAEAPYIAARVTDISLLKTKEEKLLQEQQDLSVFIDRVTHDMKGPLSSLMALHRLVALEFGHDPKVMEYFNHYHATVERLNITVLDLLNLSRVKKSVPQLKQVNLRNMVQDCLQSLCHLPDFYKITFTIRIEIKENILIEERLLQTIAQNLLENAIKYGSETSPKVLICIKQQDDQLLLEVSDNGIGIPEEAQAHIFDMFYRATTRSTGTGLGLYILKHAVEKLGGSVKVRSLPLKGSRFTVSLPYTPATEEVAEG